MQSTITQSEREALEKRIDALTKEMQPWHAKQLKAMPAVQATTIIEYLLAMQREINIRKKTKRNILVQLLGMSASSGHLSFKEWTKMDLQLWLDACRNSDEDDPKHKWIGTYNARCAVAKKFFRWLCFPDLPDYERRKLTPPPCEKMRKLKRLEESIYTANDMWTPENDAVFLKYCPRKDVKAWHTMDRDTSARPTELLKLQIEDIAFKTSPDGRRYAMIVPNGKTGQRPLPLFDSIPYLLDWLNSHPMRGNPKAPLFPNMHGKNRGKPMDVQNLYAIYVVYYQKGLNSKKRRVKPFFPSLLQDPSVPESDKAQIEELLKKPWNPYIRRHTGLTATLPKLAGPMGEQYAGWKPGSKMARRYLHFFGQEASEKVLEAAGVLPKEKTMDQILKPKICPGCGTPNTLDVLYCCKNECRMPMNMAAWQEMENDRKKRDQEFENRIIDIVEERLERRHGIKQD